MQKWGKKKGQQEYKCQSCNYRFRNKKRLSSGKLENKIYKDYALKKQTYAELKELYGKSPKTFRKYFDNLNKGTIVSFPFIREPLNIVFDATFFGRGYGILVFRANGKNIYWEEIVSESMDTITQALSMLDVICIGGYKSFTIDGRKGVIKILKDKYPNVPIQLCQFHQKQIIRRYTTNNPRTECGLALKSIMRDISLVNPDVFLVRFKILQIIFQDFLKERNEDNKFMHKRLRSAIRSIKSNIPYLFTSQHNKHLNIPNTTNSCDGSFAHWKSKIKIHRGISKNRRSQMINFLLSQQICP